MASPSILALVLLSIMGSAKLLSVQGGFYIIAVGESSRTDLPKIYAVTTFNPYYQRDFKLRLTGPGYNALLVFDLTQGRLSTIGQDHFLGLVAGAEASRHVRY
jgi:hypothetical protein